MAALRWAALMEEAFLRVSKCFWLFCTHLVGFLWVASIIIFCVSSKPVVSDSDVSDVKVQEQTLIILSLLSF